MVGVARVGVPTAPRPFPVSPAFQGKDANMARIRFLALAGAFLLSALIFPVSANPPDNADQAFNNSLKMQTAMARANECLIKSDGAGAVKILEDDLAIINGNSKYLMLLRNAYRAYYVQLCRANHDELAKKYLARLTILDGTAATDPTLRQAAIEAAKVAPTNAQLATTPPQAPPKVLENGTRLVTAEGDLKVRGVMPDPFDRSNEMPASSTGPDTHHKQALTLLAQAEAEYKLSHYAQARVLFENAHQADQQCTAQSRDRWAFCKLNAVVVTLNQANGQPCNWGDLEKEVQSALVLAPHMKTTCAELLTEIGKRRGGKSDNAAVAVKHYSANAEGWLMVESNNFRVFHQQTSAAAEQVARRAEGTRVEMARKWFGTPGEEWTPKCDIFLFNSAAEYVQQRKVAQGTPGHSRIECDRVSHKIVNRRVDLHCEGFGWLETVLPHEITHVVVATHYGSPQVPRWADEGIAVLAEPAGILEKHRANLLKCLKQGGGAFPVSELMELQNYPAAPERISAFYAQSVALVEFLSKQKGPVAFGQFLRDAGQVGYKTALTQHYGFQDYADLQNRWVQHVQATLTPTAVAKQ